MKIDIKSLPTTLRRLLKKLQHYSAFVFIIAVLGVYSFLVFQIGQLSGNEPDDDTVSEQLKTAPRIKIDQDSINKIKQLEDQNIGVQSLFKTARDNPFLEEADK
jgi:hypothetical protein